MLNTYKILVKSIPSLPVAAFAVARAARKDNHVMHGPPQQQKRLQSGNVLWNYSQNDTYSASSRSI